MVRLVADADQPGPKVGGCIALFNTLQSSSLMFPFIIIIIINIMMTAAVSLQSYCISHHKLHFKWLSFQFKAAMLFFNGPQLYNLRPLIRYKFLQFVNKLWLFVKFLLTWLQRLLQLWHFWLPSSTTATELYAWWPLSRTRQIPWPPPPSPSISQRF